MKKYFILTIFLFSLFARATENIDVPSYGDSHWRAPVANSAALPAGNNKTGDVRLTLDTFTEYVWEGASWASSGGGVSSVTASAPIVSSGGANPNITCNVASGIQPGCLSSADWTTFNGKQAAGSYITALSSDVVASGPGSAAATIQSNVVSNSKLAQAPTLTLKGNNTGLTANELDLTVSEVNTMLGDVTNVTASTPLASSGGATPNITCAVASGSLAGCLSSVDWSTFNGKQNAGSYLTALTGDVSASGPGSASSTVNLVGGSTAANVHTAEIAANAATNLNTASTIVKRDPSGNFSAGTITANVTGGASSNTTYSANNHGVVVSGSGNAMTVVAPDSSTTKVLTSGGVSADPTWQKPPVGTSSMALFTSNGTWTKSAGIISTTLVKVTVIGGGGGGSGGSTTGAGYGGPGGGGGGTSIAFIAGGSLLATETVTVGGGGTNGTGGATPTDGGAGGSSSFGGHCSATGGAGGVATTTAGGVGGAGSGGDINITGGGGNTGTGGLATYNSGNGGTGGGSIYGGGGIGGGSGTVATAGTAGGNYGGGGGGGSGGPAAGGAGATGMVLLEWIE